MGVGFYADAQLRGRVHELEAQVAALEAARDKALEPETIARCLHDTGISGMLSDGCDETSIPELAADLVIELAKLLRPVAPDVKDT